MRWMIVFCVALLCLTSATSVQAFQSEQWQWETVCDESAPAEAIDAIGQDVISQVCGGFNQCLETTPYENRQTCTVPLYLSLLDSCTGDEAYCETRAALYTAAIVQGQDDNEPLAMISRLAIDPARDSEFLSSFITYFQTNLQLNFDFYYFDPTLFLAAGAALEFQGQNEAALEVYSQIISLNALLRFRRGQLYGALGETDLASFDGLALTTLAEDTPVIEPLARILSAQYPFDASPLQDWLVYEDQSLSSGPGGMNLYDMSLTVPRAVQLGLYGDGDILFITADSYYVPTVYHRTEENVYENDYADGSTEIRFNDNVATMYQRYGYWEGSSEQRQWLAPADVSDPRPDYERCEGGARWSLMVGSNGYVPRTGSQGLPLYDAPDGNQIGEFNFFKVVNDPVCVGNVAWWEVVDMSSGEASDQHYWIREAVNSDTENVFVYQVAVSGNYDVECPTALPANLFNSLGSQAYVLPQVEAVTVHDAPASTGEILATMQTSEAFFVLDGPVCAEGNLWWRVDYDGIIGWFRGDDGQQYFGTSASPDYVP